MNAPSAQIAQMLKDSISVTYPTTKTLHCCVMARPDGEWFAFFPTDLPLEARKEIEESILDDMGVLDDKEDS